MIVLLRLYRWQRSLGLVPRKAWARAWRSWRADVAMPVHDPSKPSRPHAQGWADVDPSHPSAARAALGNVLYSVALVGIGTALGWVAAHIDRMPR